MNKKIIAIAIASAMTAPAMAADGLSISGTFGGDFVSSSKGAKYAADTTKTTLQQEDNGASQINFMATSGNAYGKFGFNMGPGANAGEYVIDGTTLNADGTVNNGVTKASASKGSVAYRDYFLGYNFSNGSSFQFGNMAGAAKNLEKDPLIATFLQTRGTKAEAVTSGAYGSSSFINNLLQYQMTAGGAKVTIQYDATDNNQASTNEGHTGIGVSGKASGVNYWVAYNNGAGNDKGPQGTSAKPKDANMKLGASMKFGAIKASLNYTSADDNTNKWNSTALSAEMDMGNGMDLVATVAQQAGDKKGDFARIAVIKSIAPKARVYAGYTSDKTKGQTANTQLGLGMSISF